MGEIKSTLELAMERTKNLSLSQEEKEEIKKKQIVLKVSGLFNRYMEESLSLGDMAREIERMEVKTATLAREALLSRLIQALSLDEGNDRQIKAIESLKGKDADLLKEELSSLRSEYERERAESEKVILAQMEEDLRKDGISGSAVVPTVQGSAEWPEKRAALERTFKGRLDRIRDAFKELQIEEGG